MGNDVKANHVFISYVSEDWEAVKQLSDHLQAYGVEVWLDKNNIKPGARWRKAIEDAIKDGAFFIACFSKCYNEKDEQDGSYMNQELNLAIDKLRDFSPKRIWFIPVKLDKCKVPEYRINQVESLPDIQWVELYEDRETGIQRILNVIQPIPNHIKVLIPVLRQSDDIKVRLASIEALGNIGHNAAIPTLEEALEDKDGQIRQAALNAIAKINRPDASESILIGDSNMVLIPAGEFQMGSNDGDDDEKPVHTVYLDAFYMDVYPVTNAQYRHFVQATGHREPWHWSDKESKFNGDNQPVVYVSWEDARSYAEWAGKRLPTEAEWEKAARGGLVGMKYPWGRNGITDKDANYGNNIGHTTPVGSYPANGYGLYDMAGNVWEWCADRYDGSYYANSPDRNPQGPDSGSYRVLRGGGWRYNPFTLRAALRNNSYPTSSNHSLGFRCSSQD